MLYDKREFEWPMALLTRGGYTYVVGTTNQSPVLVYGNFLGRVKCELLPGTLLAASSTFIESKEPIEPPPSELCDFIVFSQPEVVTYHKQLAVPEKHSVSIGRKQIFGCKSHLQINVTDLGAYLESLYVKESLEMVETAYLESEILNEWDLVTKRLSELSPESKIKVLPKLLADISELAGGMKCKEEFLYRTQPDGPDYRAVKTTYTKLFNTGEDKEDA